MRISLPIVPVPHVGDEPAAPGGPSAAPENPHVHIVRSEHGPHVLVVDGSRLYGIDAEALHALEDAMTDPNPDRVLAVLAHVGLLGAPYVDDQPLTLPPVRSLSLAVAQKCNLACTYCYAQGGAFGGPDRSMPLGVAIAAVERLFQDVAAGVRVTLAFLGGEPLTNRDVLRAATVRAAEMATAKRVHV